MNRRRKRMVIGFLCGLLIFNQLGIPVPAPFGYIEANAINGPDVRAGAYAVYNASTGKLLCEKNSAGKYAPASITKILTALIVYENTTAQERQQLLTFSETAVGAEYLPPHSSTLVPVAASGETMSVNDALYGMMLPSANECANALAEYVAGSIPGFAEMMNQKAEELGCTGSHFTNPSGIDNSDHYVTANDMGLIMKAAIKNQDLLALMSAKTYTIGDTNMYGSRSLEAGHYMVSGNYEYEADFIAGKGGNSDAAGRTLVTYVERGDAKIIVVLLQEVLGWEFFDSQTLFDFAFAYLNHEVREVIWKEKDEEVWAAEDKDKLDIYAFPNECEPLLDTLPTDEKIDCVGEYDKWYMVSFKGMTGYVLKEDVTNGEEPETEPPTTVPEETTANPFYEDVTKKEMETETVCYEKPQEASSKESVVKVIDSDDEKSGDESTSLLTVLIVLGSLSLLGGVAVLVPTVCMAVRGVKAGKKKKKKTHINVKRGN